MGLTIQVQGLRELGTAFRRMGQTDLPPAIRLAAKDAAELIAAGARAKAPSAPARRHAEGLLAANIKVLASQRGASVTVNGKRVPYAAAVHWGWPKHHIRRNPFILKALEDGHTAVVDKFSTQIRDLCARF